MRWTLERWGRDNRQMTCVLVTLPVSNVFNLFSPPRPPQIRHVGLSNETAWGLMKFLHAAELGGGVSREGGGGGGGTQGPLLPRVVSVQNAYSLTCRTFDAHLAECCHQEGVALLAYSPLAMGLLTVGAAQGKIETD